VTLRQQNLYAELFWRNQRLWVLFLIVAGLVITPAMFIAQHGRLDANTLTFLIYLPLGLLYGAAMLAYRRRSTVEVAPDGVRITKFIRSYLIPYDLVRSAKVQKLDAHFQEGRKRLVRPVTKSLLQADALFIRLVADDPRWLELQRGLGTQLAAYDTVAVPVPEPQTLAWQITANLPERVSANLGGQRRRKRARAR
jgi:hypothetical protein